MEKNDEISTLAPGLPPDSQELTKYRIVCSKHGEVSNGVATLSFATKHEDGKKHVNHFIYCLKCVNEILLSFQESGAIGKINLVPVREPVGEKPDEGQEPAKETE